MTRFTPALTVLEGRDCPAAAVLVVGHALYIATDPGSDAVRVRDDGHGRVTATVSGADGETFAGGSGIDRVFVHLRGRHDRLSVDAGPLAHDLAVTVDVGHAPDNRVRLDVPAAAGKGRLTVDLRGEAGRGAVAAYTGPRGLAGVTLIDHTGAGVTVHAAARPAGK